MGRLQELSQDLAALVRGAEGQVVRLAGRRRGATGTVWSADGLVVTALHGLGDEDEVEVALPGGGSVRGEVIGRDPTADLALVRAAAGGLAAPAFAAPDGLAPGELVVALSRPGRSVRVDLGLVARAAGEWRAPGGARVDRYLETSFALRPGLSGSLVLAADGRPVGVASAGLARGEALVVPAPTLRRSVEAMLGGGSPRRGYLGVATFPVRLGAEEAAAAGQPGALLVSGVEPGGPAARAGLKLGDAILAVDGHPVEGPHDLAPALAPERVGAVAAVRLLRAGEVRELPLTVGARPGPKERAA